MIYPSKGSTIIYVILTTQPYSKVNTEVNTQTCTCLGKFSSFHQFQAEYCTNYIFPHVNVNQFIILSSIMIKILIYISSYHTQKQTHSTNAYIEHKICFHA